MLDSLERKLIAALRQDPRATNRALAAELGVGEVTVVSRLRSLVERQLVHPTVQVNTAWLGDDLFTFVDIYVRDRDVNAVAADIQKIENVTAVSLTLGDPQIIIHLNTHDRLALADGPLAEISRIEGVERAVPNVVLKVIKYFPEYTAIAV